MANSGENWQKVGKSSEKWKKWGKVGKSGKIFSQNGRRRPFWMTENNFRSHFSSFQINAQLFIFFTKWPPVAILDDRKSLSIAVFAISDQYPTFYFFKMAASGHFGSRFFPKSIGTYLYSRSVATSNMKLIGVFLIKLWSAQAFLSYFHKMAAGGHFGFSDLLQNR